MLHSSAISPGTFFTRANKENIDRRTYPLTTPIGYTRESAIRPNKHRTASLSEARLSTRQLGQSWLLVTRAITTPEPILCRNQTRVAAWPGSMLSVTVLTHLECALCGKTHRWQELQNVCKECGRPLFARYLLAPEEAANFKRSLPERSSSVWRYREMLPVPADQEVLTLGEGGTPRSPPRIWRSIAVHTVSGSRMSRKIQPAVSKREAWRSPLPWPSILGPKNWRRRPQAMQPRRWRPMQPEPVFRLISLCPKTPHGPTLSSAK